MASVALILGVVALIIGGSGLAIALLNSGHTGPAGAAGATGTPGARGAPGLNGTNGKAGANGTNDKDGTNGLNGRNATDLWAVVNSTGSVVVGKGVNVSTTYWISPFPGAYAVLFDQSVSSCSYLGSIGGVGTPPPGFISLAPRFNSTYGVFVQTYDATGTAANESFDLGVFC